MAKKKVKKVKHVLHPIEVAFNNEMKEFKEFKTEQIKQYTSDGQSIDLAAFESHFKTMYLFGKINSLRNEIAELKGDKNVKKGKTNTRTTGKTANKSGDGQLQLGL